MFSSSSPLGPAARADALDRLANEDLDVEETGLRDLQIEHLLNRYG
jgi:hypothetical protein